MDVATLHQFLMFITGKYFYLQCGSRRKAEQPVVKIGTNLLFHFRQSHFAEFNGTNSPSLSFRLITTLWGRERELHAVVKWTKNWSKMLFPENLIRIQLTVGYRIANQPDQLNIFWSVLVTSLSILQFLIFHPRIVLLIKDPAVCERYYVKF